MEKIRAGLRGPARRIEVQASPSQKVRFKCLGGRGVGEKGAKLRNNYLARGYPPQEKAPKRENNHSDFLERNQGSSAN